MGGDTKRRGVGAQALGLLAAVVVLVGLAARPAESAGRTPWEDDVDTLSDPHSGSNQKLAAIGRLTVFYNGAVRIAPDDGRRVLNALARQTFYDMGPVRDAARESLNGMLGRANTMELLANYVAGTSGNRFATDWLNAVRKWPDAEGIRANLRGGDAAGHGAALRAIAARSGANPKLLDGVRAAHRNRLVEDVERFDRAHPSWRVAAIAVVEQLNPNQVSAVPLLLRAMGDTDPKVKAAARRLASRTLDDLAGNRLVVGALAEALADSSPEVGRAVSAALAEIQRQSDAELVKRSAAARSAVGAAEGLSRGDPEALAALSGIDPVTFGEAVYGQLSGYRPSRNRAALVRALGIAGTNQHLDELPALRGALFGFLAEAEEPLAVAAAELLTVARDRADATAALVAKVSGGQCLSLKMLETLKPDRDVLNREMTVSLRIGSPAAQASAARVLAVVGVVGEEPRKALVALLRRPEVSVRMAAAEALGTAEARAVARVPEVLGDLRSDDFHTRQMAARQFDGLALESAAVSAALLRAVDRRDLAAREGLLGAIERAFASEGRALEVLKESAESEVDPTRRAYARAGLREVMGAGK